MGFKQWKCKKTCLSMLLVVTCLLSSFLFLFINARADYIIRTGTVVEASSLNLRSGPGTEYGVVGYLYNGDTGRIIGEATATTGRVWYQMEINGMTGWASSYYIKVEQNVIVESKDFDEYLTAQGFPESYKSKLQALHQQYPNWKFEAQHTNLDWSYAIAGESSLAKNLVHSGAPTSWKSTQSGAYNWETGAWVEFDSGGWVAASTEIVQYFMDPRNFLDSTNIFQFIKQSYNPLLLTDEQLSQKKTDLASMVKGTYLAGICPGSNSSYVDVIMEAASASGVCPFTLASMMIQEQGTDGSGRSISGTVPGFAGYYNHLNIGAYKTSTMSAVERGLWFASGSGSGYTSYRRPWNNCTDSVIGGSIYYGEGYVKIGQDTLYLKKFNVQGSNLFGHQYMTNVQGAASEGKHMAKAYDENARQAALVFKIPVYKNMPETVCPQPSSNDNPNYMLQSLVVNGYSLTPTFSIYETAYSLIVEHEVTSVTIAAQAIAPTTSVSGVGVHNLNVGKNVIHVVTTAQNGAQRTYVIDIVRKEAVIPNPEPETPPVVIPTPEVTTPNYSINSDSTITGLNDFASLTAADFKAKFAVNNGSVKVTTASGSEKPETAKVGTGDQIRVYDNGGVHKLTYTVVIYGDTNGDGRINAQDLLTIQKNNIRLETLSGVYNAAADANHDGRVNAQDLLAVQKHNIRLSTIQQGR